MGPWGSMDLQLGTTELGCKVSRKYLSSFFPQKIIDLISTSLKN